MYMILGLVGLFPLETDQSGVCSSNIFLLISLFIHVVSGTHNAAKGYIYLTEFLKNCWPNQLVRKERFLRGEVCFLGDRAVVSYY